MGDKRTFVLTVEGAGPTAPAECVGLGVSLTVMLWGHSQYWLEDRVEGVDIPEGRGTYVDRAKLIVSINPQTYSMSHG